MIASVTGVVQSIRDNSCVIDVNGLGYLVFLTEDDKRSLAIGESTLLFTSLVVREDSLTLYGFTAPEAVEIFETLLSVSGVGPRSALAILSTMSAAQILAAVVDENDAAFKKVPGVGPKTAKLIIVQLTGKINALSIDTSESSGATDSVSTTVLNALIGLGWNERQAQEALSSAQSLASAQDSASLLKAALSILAGN